MSIFADLQTSENTIFISRSDPNEPLSSFAEYPFELDDSKWLTVEHYFQSMKYDDPWKREKIRQSATAKIAKKLGRSKKYKIRDDWSSIKQTIMTRATYIKFKTHDELSEILLNTAPKKIIENNQYDYYWGCGRDRRGFNYYGKILMAVRDKISKE